jgi:outer membrane protein assembly factor BamE (lipoprotein component of BamABCDE complex)
MRIVLLVIFLLVVNCKFNKITDSHGSHYLEKKEKELLVNLSNKNDIIALLGPPSTKSQFDNALWIYIERKKTRTTLLKFGKKKIYVNNVLLLEIDSKGLLAKKKLLNINDMKDIEFVKDETEISYSKRSFVYDFLSSMRQKVNDPLGVRAKKRKKIKSQQ